MKFFLSYARTDTEIALKIATQLRQQGANIWVDQLDLVPGQEWDRVIEEKLTECDCLLYIVSRSSVSSTNVLNEVDFALDEKKQIVPVKIENCKMPLRIRRLQYIDISTNYKIGFESLVKIAGLNKQVLYEQAQSNTEKNHTSDKIKLKTSTPPKAKYWKIILGLAVCGIITFVIILNDRFNRADLTNDTNNTPDSQMPSTNQTSNTTTEVLSEQEEKNPSATPDESRKTENKSSGSIADRNGMKYSREGISLFNEGKYEEAITQLNSAISLNPQMDAISKLYLAHCYFYLKDYGRAIDSYTNALNTKNKYFKQSSRAECFLFRGSSKEHLGDLESACQDYYQADELGHPDAKEFLSKCN